MRVVHYEEARQVWGAGGPAGIGGPGDAGGGVTIGNIGPAPNDQGISFSIDTPLGSMSVVQGPTTLDSISMSMSNGSVTCSAVVTADAIGISCNDGTAVSCDANGNNCSVGSNGGDW